MQPPEVSRSFRRATLGVAPGWFSCLGMRRCLMPIVPHLLSVHCQHPVVALDRLDIAHGDRGDVG